MKRVRPATALAALTVWGVTAWASPTAAQPGPPPAASEADGRTQSPQLTTPNNSTLGAAQITRPGRLPADPASQLTGERGARTPVNQLNREGRSTAGVAPLSSTTQSRPTATAPLGGQDDCDPERTPAFRLAACARALETRASEFTARTAPELSPEQRILASQQPDAPPMADARVAARRLATGEPEDSVAAQAVAVASNRPTDIAVEADLSASVAAGDAVQALVEALTGGTGLPFDRQGTPQ